MKELLYWFIQLFVKQKPKGKRVTPVDVKPKDIVKVEWWRFKEGIGTMICIANDTETKDILLRAKFLSEDNERGFFYAEQVFSYNAYALRHFNLLNQHLLGNLVNEDGCDETNLIELQRVLNEALEEEDYPKAHILQNKIDKLVQNR